MSSIRIQNFTTKKKNQHRPQVDSTTSLLEIPLNEAKKVFKDNPLDLLKRAQRRLDRNILATGVRIINEE